MSEDKVQIAYALWRKQTIAERRSSASFRAGVAFLPLAVGVILGYADAPKEWYIAVGMLLALNCLVAFSDQNNADRVPSWHDLIRNFDYEVWRVSEEGKSFRG